MHETFRGGWLTENSVLDLSEWDVSRVTSMKRMFQYQNKYTGAKTDFRKWNTSSNTDMEEMFRAEGHNGGLFTGDVSLFDTSKVRNMKYLFRSQFPFNGDISRWDTGKVTNMQLMFQWAKTFNGDIGQWDTSSLNEADGMFYQAEKFNKDISKYFFLISFLPTRTLVNIADGCAHLAASGFHARLYSCTYQLKDFA